MCFDRENNRQIAEYPLYLHEDEKGNSEIIGRKGRKVRRLEMGGGMPEGGEPYKQLVTDGEGVAKWEDRLAYSNELDSFEVAGNWYFRVGDVPLDMPAGDFETTLWMLDNGVETGVQDIMRKKTEGIWISRFAYVIATTKDNLTIENGDEIVNIPKAGIYFSKKDEGSFVAGYASSADATAPEIEWDGQTSVVKQIDPKYIPEGVGGSAQTNQLVIHNEYEQPRKANMTYAEIVDALYGGKPLYGAIVESVASDSSGVTIYPITGIAHFSGAEIPYIEIRHFDTFVMQEGSIYMTEDNAFSGMKPGGGGLS